jgi:hypothetical protein
LFCNTKAVTKFTVEKFLVRAGARELCLQEDFSLPLTITKKKVIDLLMGVTPRPIVSLLREAIAPWKLSSLNT